MSRIRGLVLSVNSLAASRLFSVSCRRAFSHANNPAITRVEKIVLDNIKAAGPISFATYMQLCLSHPTEGYYMNPSNAVFGSKGDFTTSPEISQIFGELLGVWFLSQWMRSGAASGIRLIELGPGRGTLMDDMIRAFSQFPASRSALKQVHLVENSPSMQHIQKGKLLKSAQEGGWEVLWHESIDDIPPASDNYTMLVAHEFFDALPIHILEKTHDGWQEVLISSAADPASPSILTNANVSSTLTPVTLSNPRLRRVLSSSPTPLSTLLGMSSPRFQKLPIGARVEVSPMSFKLARKVGELLCGKKDGKKLGGCALIVDYGGEKAFGDSFRAFRDHKIVDVFHRPGECDLTANVDFAYLIEAVTDIVSTHGPLPQAKFLDRMGLQVRAGILKSNAKTTERKNEIEKAAKRLVDVTGMGIEYQVVGLTCTERQSADEGMWPFMEPEIEENG